MSAFRTLVALLLVTLVFAGIRLDGTVTQIVTGKIAVNVTHVVHERLFNGEDFRYVVPVGNQHEFIAYFDAKRDNLVVSALSQSRRYDCLSIRRVLHEDSWEHQYTALVRTDILSFKLYCHSTYLENTLILLWFAGLLVVFGFVTWYLIIGQKYVVCDMRGLSIFQRFFLPLSLCVSWYFFGKIGNFLFDLSLFTSRLHGVVGIIVLAMALILPNFSILTNFSFFNSTTSDFIHQLMYPTHSDSPNSSFSSILLCGFRSPRFYLFHFISVLILGINSILNILFGLAVLGLSCVASLLCLLSWYYSPAARCILRFGVCSIFPSQNLPKFTADPVVVRNESEPTKIFPLIVLQLSLTPLTGLMQFFLAMRRTNLLILGHSEAEKDEERLRLAPRCFVTLPKDLEDESSLTSTFQFGKANVFVSISLLMSTVLIATLTIIPSLFFLSLSFLCCVFPCTRARFRSMFRLAIFVATPLLWTPTYESRKHSDIINRVFLPFGLCLCAPTFIGSLVLTNSCSSDGLRTVAARLLQPGIGIESLKFELYQHHPLDRAGVCPIVGEYVQIN